MKNFCKFLLLWILLPLSSFSQNTLLSEAAIKIQLADPVNQLSSGLFQVMITDTADVAQIEVKLGTSSGIDDLSSTIFDYDVLSPASGYTYSRIGYSINLGVPLFAVQSTYYGQVRVKNMSGVWSDPMLFVAN